MSDKIFWKILVKYFYEWQGLLAGYVIMVFFAFPVLEKPIKNFFPEKLYQYAIFITISVLWPGIWSLLRNYLPRSGKGKIGIIIAMDAENLKQKTRIKVDFVSGLRALLSQNNLSQLFDIVVLSDYQTKRSIKILYDYSHIATEIKAQFTGGVIIAPKPKEIIQWEEYQKKTRGHFFIWGYIKERLDEQNKYFLNIDALVVHKPVDIKTGDKLNKEFRNIFPKEISFIEKLEVRGFHLTANTIYLAVRYMTGIAALISGDPYIAIKLHDTLKDEINIFSKPLPPNLIHIGEELDKLLCVEKLLIARFSYFNENNVGRAKELIDSCLAVRPLNYEALLLSSIIAFKDEKNPLEALKLINKASKCSNGDFTWLYNKAFLLMYLGKFDESVKLYKKLVNVNFKEEASITKQCID